MRSEEKEIEKYNSIVGALFNSSQSNNLHIDIFLTRIVNTLIAIAQSAIHLWINTKCKKNTITTTTTLKKKHKKLAKYETINDSFVVERANALAIT